MDYMQALIDMDKKHEHIPEEIDECEVEWDLDEEGEGFQEDDEELDFTFN